MLVDTLCQKCRTVSEVDFKKQKHLTKNIRGRKIWGVHGANGDSVREWMQHKPANGLAKKIQLVLQVCMLKSLSQQFLSCDVQTTNGQQIFGGCPPSAGWALSFLSQMLHHAEDVVNGCQTKPSHCYHCCRGIYRTAHGKWIRSKGWELKFISALYLYGDME